MNKCPEPWEKEVVAQIIIPQPRRTRGGDLIHFVRVHLAVDSNFDEEFIRQCVNTIRPVLQPIDVDGEDPRLYEILRKTPIKVVFPDNTVKEYYLNEKELKDFMFTIRTSIID